LMSAREFRERLREAMKDETPYGHRMLRQWREMMGDLQNRLPVLQQLKEDRNFKGQLGEQLAEVRDSMIGEVTASQQVEGQNRIDRITRLSGNTRFTKVRFEEGALRVDAAYEPAGTLVASEVKNGTLDSILTKVRDGSLDAQVRAGLQVADVSQVEINQDTLMEMLRSSEKAQAFVEQVQTAGGRVVVDLPSYNKQLQIFMNA
ncbi:MAG TPA: hypothetical protein VD902_02270, partial [Symbiobacteriaceae bacterium]|nr:hypothetical protein [Symbiobacteriaceae bacterium]